MRYKYLESFSHVLVNKDRVSVRVNSHKTGGSRGGFIGFANQWHACRFQLTLKIAYIGEAVELAGVAVPARIEVSMSSRNIPWSKETVTCSPFL